nr:hypothetical protein [Chloroflexota bacterium]
DARNAAFEQAVADGTITQEQVDWMQSRWEYMQENGYGPGSDFCDDSGTLGGTRGPGMRGSWNTQP